MTPTHTRTCPGRVLCRGERGSASVELVLVFPLVLLAVLLLAQVSLWAHARQLAQAAASQALTATRVRDATAVDGQRAARQVLAQLGPGPLHNPRVTVTRGAQRATVDITGQAPSITGLLPLPVRAHAEGPTEPLTHPAPTP